MSFSSFQPCSCIPSSSSSVRDVWGAAAGAHIAPTMVLGATSTYHSKKVLGASQHMGTIQAKFQTRCWETGLGDKRWVHQACVGYRTAGWPLRDPKTPNFLCSWSCVELRSMRSWQRWFGGGGGISRHIQLGQVLVRSSFGGAMAWHVVWDSLC